MKIQEITINAAGSGISVSVEAIKYPQSTAGVVWRYKSDESPDGKAGEFTTKLPNVSLGLPADTLSKFFLIEGAVLNQNDNPPTPYQIQVTVWQGDEKLHEAIPEDGGSGQIGNQDKGVSYAFQIK